jgi:hypothetical protein
MSMQVRQEVCTCLPACGVLLCLATGAAPLPLPPPPPPRPSAVCGAALRTYAPLTQQELAAEVEARQAAVWAPSTPQDTARTPLQRQQRLQAARAQLAASMQQARQQRRQQQCGASGAMSAGGFMVDDA